MKNWQQYQEDVAAMFRGLDLHAETDIRRDGARGQHDVDVLVTFRASGVDVLWVVECKQWKKRAVPKERVLVLQQIVADLGADRGLLFSESGFQAGAVRAADHSNITLTSLTDLRANAESERLRAVAARHLGRCAAIAERVRRLWLWTSPHTVQPAVPVDAVIEVAGHSFELQNFVVPRLITGELPFVISVGHAPLQVTTPNEREQAVLGACSTVEDDLASLELIVGTVSAQAFDSLATVAVHLEQLVAVGRSLRSPAQTMEREQTAFVDHMKALDATAKALLQQVPPQVVEAIRAIMRHLLDSTYLLPAQASGDWDGEQEKLDHLLEVARSALQSAAPIS